MWQDAWKALLLYLYQQRGRKMGELHLEHVKFSVHYNDSDDNDDDNCDGDSGSGSVGDLKKRTFL
jgi:hypothetical protein